MIDIKRHPHYSFLCRVFHIATLIYKQNEQMSVHHTRFDNVFLNTDDVTLLLYDHINRLVRIDIQDS